MSSYVCTCGGPLVGWYNPAGYSVVIAPCALCRPKAAELDREEAEKEGFAKGVLHCQKKLLSVLNGD